MRMQKEEKIVAVLLLMALGSLAVAYWAFSLGEESASSDGIDETVKVNEASVSLEGNILNLKRTIGGGHLLIRLDSTSLPVFVSRSNGAQELAEKLGKGDRLMVKGIKRVYQGQEEIEVSRPIDVRKI